jgi:hypothetical protein
MTIPKTTAVTITDSDDENHGETAFVHRLPGETTASGDYVPDGWYELALDPHTHGFGTELYREENVEICGC